MSPATTQLGVPVGQPIRVFRKHLGASQETCAQLAGMSRTNPTRGACDNRR